MPSRTPGRFSFTALQSYGRSPVDVSAGMVKGALARFRRELEEPALFASHRRLAPRETAACRKRYRSMVHSKVFRRPWPLAQFDLTVSPMSGCFQNTLEGSVANAEA